MRFQEPQICDSSKWLMLSISTDIKNTVCKRISCKFGRPSCVVPSCRFLFDLYAHYALAKNVGFVIFDWLTHKLIHSLSQLTRQMNKNRISVRVSTIHLTWINMRENAMPICKRDYNVATEASQKIEKNDKQPNTDYRLIRSKFIDWISTVRTFMNLARGESNEINNRITSTQQHSTNHTIV